MTPRATVALVEWNWGGHNETYFKHYIRALARCGASVVPVVSRPEVVPGLHGASGFLSDPEIATRLASAVEFQPSPLWRIRPTRMAVHLRARATFRRLGGVLREWEHRNRTAIDLVFFACMYDDDFPRARLVSSGLGKAWAGLYLQGRIFHRLRDAGEARLRRQARISFGSRELTALGVLEPRILELASSALPSAGIRQFPDILEPLSDLDTEEARLLREEMLCRAGGRPIVSLLGHIQRSKGVELFLRAACDPRLDDVSFFVGGEFLPSSFSRDGVERVHALMRRAPRLHAHLNRLSESCFNAAARASDVLFAAYLDFPYSSNVQGKAAQLHRPMIATDGTLMGERCKAFKLGECVKENDLDSVVHAVRKLTASACAYRDDQSIRSLHDQYVALHDERAVAAAMEWTLQRSGL